MLGIRLLKMSPSPPSSMSPITAPNSSSRGATSWCNRFSSYIADNRPIVTTTKVWYCGDHSGTARPLICGLHRPQAMT